MNGVSYKCRRVWRELKAYWGGPGAIELLPARGALRGYTLRKAGRDLKAAADVALVGLPQGMAFAAMAGLDSIYGIMAATVGTFIAPFFTRCSLTVSGPSNATASSSHRLRPFVSTRRFLFRSSSFWPGFCVSSAPL